MHSVASPRFGARRFISCSSVTRMRVPLAPIGWPSAIAPPFTFTRSQSQPSSRPTASDCAANASFASIRSISASDRPDFARTFRVAGRGPSPLTPRAAPVVDAGGVAGGPRPVARERRSQPAEHLRRRVRPQVLVLIDDDRALPLLDLHRHDLLREYARPPGAAR